MARGGRRGGTPGKAYFQRSDLNQTRTLPVQTATGQPYGAATAQREAQQAVPMASGPLLTEAAGPLPGLTSPTMRPDEPLSAGAPFGPGPGPQASPQEMGLADLRAIYAAHSTEDVRELIEEMELG